MLRHALLAAPLLLALAAPSLADAPTPPPAPAGRAETSFVAEVTFQIQRGALTEDPTGTTEQAVVDAAKKTLGADYPGELEVKVERAASPDHPSAVELKLRSPSDLRPVIEQMVLTVKGLKTERPVALVRQAVRSQTWRTAEGESQQQVDRGAWERTWRKSMDDMERRLRVRLTADHGQARVQVSDDDEDERAPSDGEHRQIEVRKRVERRDQGEQATRGVLKLLVDEAKGKVQRLVASEVPLGAILARLAGVLPVSYVLADPGLARTEVSLALSDATADQVLQALARAAECATTTEAGVLVFTRKR